jgi:protein-S-isoprenylcysteine O-methyltransferase Ste14
MIRLNVLFAIIWIGWLVSWMAAAFWTGRTEKRAVTWQIWVYRAALVAGAILLLHSTRRLLGEARIWHVGYGGAYVLAVLALAGIGYAWWSRIHLGRLWSSTITRKEDHRVVDSGPYGWVRHPIYAGLMVAIMATAAAQASVSGLAGAALIAFGFWVKARAEERFLMEELGAAAYGDYRRRVPMLVPFLRG